MNKVDETIEMLCDWIQKQVSNGKCVNIREVSEMVKVLADLVHSNAFTKATTDQILSNIATKLEEKANLL